ncbi:MAG: radical SAM protein [Desulfarculus sp.]|nr:radical SAM protein [Pseudomonadota bacterium]MBV1716559.1 radical SAM protein [Desulfarculus sp.]MBU4574793.1 radical SAM protein [Pseudomonadota bacterium]MBU4597687.1 radical SAM protein [Pseudomonadota bacterium]MBV1736787.1 radical SAM protein [Desulfarculus sp.]
MPLAAAEADLSHSSPEYVRLSLAAAMTLGFAQGRFFRNARLGCINLLLTYPGGCKANCAFCGLARESQIPAEDPRFQKFIRVIWRAYALDQVVEACAAAPPHVERVCISMITHPRAREDTLEICRRVRAGCGLPVSLLIAPTILKRENLLEMKDAGADRIGVAIDAATPELFAKFRGKPAGGPHRWEHYWEIYQQSIEIFGRDMAGVHLIYGLGETEEELVWAMDRARRLGGYTHLFCFYPERFSALSDTPQPPASGYRRIQLARWLIDHDQAKASDMAFDGEGRIVFFGDDPEIIENAIASGRPFMTSGCPGASGEVACNRPYGNERPGPDLRNYPFLPEAEDITLVREQLATY